MTIDVRGEQLDVRGDRCVFWPAERTLFVADTHFGKTESFRRFGVPVPGAATSGTLRRLTAALTDTAADRLIVLGDFWHAAAGVTDDVLAELSAWRQAHESVSVEVILGNHDLRSGGVPAGLGMAVHPKPVMVGPFVAAHFPEPDSRGYVLAGHLHPGFALRGRGRQSLRLPCFWFGRHVGVLPAFGGFTGTVRITPRPADRVLVTADGEVAEVPV